MLIIHHLVQESVECHVLTFFLSKKGMRPPLSAASTGARSQLHSSTITGGYVQQVPYPKDDTQTRHSQLGEYFILAT